MTHYTKMDVAAAKDSDGREHVMIEGVARAPSIVHASKRMGDNLSFLLQDNSGFIRVEITLEQLLPLVVNKKALEKWGSDTYLKPIEQMLQASSESGVPVTVQGCTCGNSLFDAKQRGGHFNYLIMHGLLFDGRYLQF